MNEFIRLQLKLKWGFNRNNDKKSAIMTAVASCLAIAVALALVWALTFVLKASMSVDAKKLSQLYITIIMIALTVVATGMQVTRLYKPADMMITARFPLSPFKLFMGYLILNYIDLTIYATILLLPIMIAYGVAMHCISALYIVGIILGAVLLPMVPFAVSVFLAIPIVYISQLLSKHGVLRLIIFVVFLVGCFVLYYYILNVLADFFIHRDWETGTLEIWDKILTGLDSKYNPAVYLANVIFFKNFLVGLGVTVVFSAVLTAIGVAIARIVCSDIRNKALENGFGGYKRVTTLDNYGSARAIWRYTFREILRTKTYSYFYLGVAISTPVMVFLCHRLVSMVGEAQIGKGINFGVSVLVIAVFMAMICSFTGTILSVEGKNFYITKLVPVGFRKQLLIKSVLNVLVSVVALIISAVVLWALDFVSLKELGVIVLSQFLLAVGLVFNGVNLNLANPNLKPKANGETEEINITYMLLIGLVIAAGLGACSIIFPRKFDNGALYAYIVCAGVGALYALVNILVFIFTAEKKYRNIEI